MKEHHKGHHAGHSKHHSSHGHKEHHPMKSNEHEHDSHQEGISRVMQRPGDLHKGQGGKMSWKGGGHESNFERHGGSMTPRKG